MTHTIHDIAVAKQIGAYSDAIETKSNLRWLYTSGTPGLSEAGISRRTFQAKPNLHGSIFSRC